jgi:hypothetical protein
MAFSREIWHVVSESFQAIPAQTPTTLQEAIEIWTLSNFQKIFDHIDFHPTYDGLEGNSKATVNELFRDRRIFFFIGQKEIKSSPLEPFSSIPDLYLSKYHTILATQTPQEIEHLHQDLDLIFSMLQCLPLSMKERQRDLVFKLTNGRIQTILNARYYRIKGTISQRSRITKNRAQVTAASLRKKLLKTT